MINIFILLILINYTLQATSLIFFLSPGEDVCLHEYFTDKTLALYEITSNSTDTNIKIKDPKENILYDADTNSLKQPITISNGGYYESCILNKQRGDYAEISFSLKSGVEVKDYSEVAKSKDLKPIEVDVILFINIVTKII